MKLKKKYFPSLINFKRENGWLNVENAHRSMLAERI